MAKIPVITIQNAKAGEMELNETVSGTAYNPFVVKDAVVQYMAGKRQGTHSTKGRSEIAGSTKKPWKQKGTGRARAGSTKSPIWRTGGIVFGPKPRSHALKINKKVRNLALRSALAEKIRLNDVIVVDKFDLDSPKTKAFSGILAGLNTPKVLIVSQEISENLRLASRNIQGVEVIKPQSLNVYKLLRHPKVIFAQDALKTVEERLLA